MEQLGIALAGVLVGAIVTEGLRLWRGHVETQRRLRGARRLVRNELIVNSVMLAGSDVTPEMLRERLKTGAICADHWTASETMLAETLPSKEWVELAAANLLLARLAADIELTTDEHLEAIAKDLSQQMDQARARLDKSLS